MGLTAFGGTPGPGILTVVHALPGEDPWVSHNEIWVDLGFSDAEEGHVGLLSSPRSILELVRSQKNQRSTPRDLNAGFAHTAVCTGQGKKSGQRNPFAGLARSPYDTTAATEETSDMEQTKQRRETTHGIRLGRIAAAAFAVGGLSASAFAVGTAGAATSREAKTVTVSTVKSDKFGKILVSGKTLYTLKPNKTACTAQCVTIWPELVLPAGVTKATAGTGVSASKLGTVARSGGVLQVTYAGKPLYWFSGDTAAGQVHGNVTDTWGKWTVVATAKPAKSSSSSSSGGSSSGSGGAGF